MAGTPYALNYLAPQARDARADSYAQLREYVKGPRPELNVAAEDVHAGTHLWSRRTGDAFLVTLAPAPGEVYARAVEMLSLGYAPARDAVWLDITHGYEILSPEEAAAEVAEMNARADRDEQDRADRWGGWWDDQD
jgi:hypothetical protein